MVIRKRPELDTTNPPGQIVNHIPGPDTLKHNIEEWKKYEEQKSRQTCPECGNKHFLGEVPKDCEATNCYFKAGRKLAPNHLVQGAARCPACNGNDADAPCAFPEGGQPRCLRETSRGKFVREARKDE